MQCAQCDLASRYAHQVGGVDHGFRVGPGCVFRASDMSPAALRRSTMCKRIGALINTGETKAVMGMKVVR